MLVEEEEEEDKTKHERPVSMFLKFFEEEE